MKKNLVYAMMSAIALTSAVSFTGCASDDGASVDTNPTYDGKSVRTDFAFSITKASEETRMTGANVQETAPFRGMSEMFLLPFSTEPAAGGSTNAANFPLGTLTTSDITATVGDRTSSKSSKVYSLMLPLGTNNFLFYGKATNTGDQSGFEVGKVTTTLTKNTKYTTKVTSPEADNGIYFSLNSIVEDEADVSTDGLNKDGDATKILDFLNEIANTTGWASTVETAQSSSAEAGNYRALAKLYTKFTNTNNSGPRAGSAEAVARTLLDLYRSAKEINGTSPITEVTTIATAISNTITNGVNGVKVIIMRADGETPLDGSASDGEPNTWTAVLDGLAGTNANKTFPANLGLPMGAAQLTWVEGSTSGQYEFKYNDTPTSFSGGVVTAYSNSIGQYRYPAELIYYCNSPLLATDKYKTVGDYPTTAANWDIGVGTGGFSSDWDKTEVTPSTRAVAMQNNVNYGVALLETTVRLKGGTLFDDNRAAILADDGVTENQHDIDGTKFKVTGLLIGGQPETVGWNMVNPNASDKTEIIYDKEVQYGNGLLEAASSSNYTVVFDNYTTPGSNNEQPNVLIALQIKNGDKDFYGYDGLIPAGSTFYLVGTLNPTTNTPGTTDYTKASRPASYRITEESVQRVFMQDYKTVASIGLSNSHALKRAYSTIPDLRSTEIVFGLSVDLKWEKGVSFDITIN